MFNFLKSLFKPKIGMGALESPVDPRNIALASFQLPVDLPLKFDTELEDAFNQGSKSCCVGCGITGVADLRLNAKLSYDDLYEQCKLADGIPDVLGTFPIVGAKIATNIGIATVEAYNSKDPQKIAESRAKNKLSGYAFVAVDFDSICQAIYLNRVITASFVVSSDWFRGIITKILSSVGMHYVILKGFDRSNNTLKGRNSWGIGWIGYIAGIFNKEIKGGEFEMKWGDYQDKVMDIIAFTYVPPEILETVKKDFRFTTTMRMGSSGYEVKKLQERLGITADGKFGRQTQNAVKSFQQINGLVADGVLGAQTRFKLNINTMSLVPLWAKAIQNHEGYYVGSRSYRNNSPANFKLSGTMLSNYMVKLGATSIDKDKFVVFPNYEIGFNALCMFLRDACNNKLTSYRGTMTIQQFFAVYAPASENDTVAYAKVVAKAVGGILDTPISELL